MFRRASAASDVRGPPIADPAISLHNGPMRLLSCTAALVALPLGMIIGCSPGAPDSSTAARGNSASTTYQELRTGNVYSPNVATDPYVIEEQRRVAQALRLSCEQFETHCREAEQARRFVAEAEARR